ncbi:MAG: hypothetical protein WBA12_14470, partial [Catalinimonas sp.]
MASTTVQEQDASALLLAAVALLLFGDCYSIITPPDKLPVAIVEMLPRLRLFGMILRVLTLSGLAASMLFKKSIGGLRPLPWAARIVCWLIALACAFVFVRVHVLPRPWVVYAYPVSLLAALLAFAATVVRAGGPLMKQFLLRPESRRISSPLGFSLRTRGGWFNVPNPFRGWLITGGAGAGKSESVITPTIYQAIEKQYSGVLYDFKFPELTHHAYAAYVRSGGEHLRFRVLNFVDLERT